MSDITETVLDPRQSPTQHVVVLQALHAAPQRAAKVLAALPASAHDWQPAPDTWSARMLLAHLAGSEAPFVGRMQAIAGEDNPFLPYFGPDVARPDAPGSAAELLAQYEQARGDLVQFLVDLQPAQWERPATHETMGATTLALQAQNIANHDADHLEQLTALAHAWAQRSDD